jgi:four helix bundle protein
MNYEDLDVFKKAHNLVLKIYQITENFPAKEQFRIVSQMIKAAYSIPANIAEGSSRNTKKSI